MTWLILSQDHMVFQVLIDNIHVEVYGSPPNHGCKGERISLRRESICIEFTNHIVIQVLGRINEHTPILVSHLNDYVAVISLTVDFKPLFSPYLSVCQFTKPFLLFMSQESCVVEWLL